MKNVILQGDALTKLKELPEKSINMCMTSPPYWALRDYGVDGQLGLEPSVDEYINSLCNIFDEVKKVLRDDGTCWVNLGDTYNAGRNGGHAGGKKCFGDSDNNLKAYPKQSGTNAKGIPAKSLTMIPQRFAIEMINRGWILRNIIIWHKNNPMPHSVKDRFTVDFEQIFFFSKNKKYHFKQQLEDAKWAEEKRAGLGRLHYRGKREGQPGTGQENFVHIVDKRNMRTTWSINTKPFKGAHFAVYPEELCITPIDAGCPEDGIVLDPFFGSGTTGVAALKQNKNYIGIELNPEYIEIAEKRLQPLKEQSSPNVQEASQ